MNITFKEENGCPFMIVTKGNITLIHEGMQFILGKIIIEHDDRIEEITDDNAILEFDEAIYFTKEEMKEMCRMAQNY